MRKRQACASAWRHSPRASPCLVSTSPIWRERHQCSADGMVWTGCGAGCWTNAKIKVCWSAHVGGLALVACAWLLADSDQWMVAHRCLFHSVAVLISAEHTLDVDQSAT